MEAKPHKSHKTLISLRIQETILLHNFPHQKVLNRMNTPDSQTPHQESNQTLNNKIDINSHPDPKSNMVSDQLEKKDEVNETPKEPEQKEEEEEEEEEEECGFCLFMKGGECKVPFIAWEKCMDEAEELKVDIVEKCFEVTNMLKMCMEANSGYYAPILNAEKSAKEEALKEIEKEKMNSDQNGVADSATIVD